MLRFGNVEVADYDSGRYTVYFPQDDVVSFPLPHVVFSTSPGKVHAPIAVGTWVACLLDDSGTEGVVLGPYYTEKTPPVSGGAAGEYTLTLQDAKVSVAPDGIEIAKGAETLGGLIDELITAVSTLAPVSASPGAPSSPNPVDVTKLNLLKTRVKTLLK